MEIENESNINIFYKDTGTLFSIVYPKKFKHGWLVLQRLINIWTKDAIEKI